MTDETFRSRLTNRRPATGEPSPAQAAGNLAIEMRRQHLDDQTGDIVVLSEAKVKQAIPSGIRALPTFPLPVEGVKGRFYWRRQILDFLDHLFAAGQAIERRNLVRISADAPESAFTAARRVMSEGEFLAQSPEHGGTPLPIEALARISVPVVDLRHSGAGIYFLWVGPTIVYVGQTTVGFARILVHFATKKFDAVSFVRCAEGDLEAVERAYINAFLPELNTDSITMKIKRERDHLAGQYTGKIGPRTPRLKGRK